MCHSLVEAVVDSEKAEAKQIMVRIKEKNPTTAITTVRSKLCKFAIENSRYCQETRLASARNLKLSQMSQLSPAVSLLEQQRKYGTLLEAVVLTRLRAVHCQTI